MPALAAAKPAGGTSCVVPAYAVGGVGSRSKALHGAIIKGALMALIKGNYRKIISSAEESTVGVSGAKTASICRVLSFRSEGFRVLETFSGR